MTTPSGTIKHRDYIDAVRGVAILWVISFHCAQNVGHFPLKRYFDQGALGVPLFFLASALTLRSSWAQRKDDESHPIRFFYLRRLARIAPMYWLSLLFYQWVPGVIPAFWLGQFAPQGTHAVYYGLNALFLHTWHPYALNSVVPGGWSIGVEMMFYVVCPLFFLGLFTGRRVAIAALIGLCLATALSGTVPFALRTWFIPPVASDSAFLFWAQHWFLSQLPAFLLGFCCYHLVNHRSVVAIVRDPFWAGALVALCALALFSLLYSSSYFVPMTVWIEVVMAAAIVAVSGDVLPYLMPRFLRYIGTVSYSAYLVHFAVLGTALKLLHVQPGQNSPNPEFGSASGNFLHFLLLGALTLVGTVAVSTLTYRFVEKPGIDWGRRLILRLNTQQRSSRLPNLEEARRRAS